MRGAGKGSDDDIVTSLVFRKAHAVCNDIHKYIHEVDCRSFPLSVTTLLYQLRDGRASEASTKESRCTRN